MSTITSRYLFFFFYWNTDNHLFLKIIETKIVGYHTRADSRLRGLPEIIELCDRVAAISNRRLSSTIRINMHPNICRYVCYNSYKRSPSNLKFATPPKLLKTKWAPSEHSTLPPSSKLQISHGRNPSSRLARSSQLLSEHLSKSHTDSSTAPPTY